MLMTRCEKSSYCKVLGWTEFQDTDDVKTVVLSLLINVRISKVRERSTRQDASVIFEKGLDPKCNLAINRAVS